MSGNVTKDISTFDEMIHVHPRSSSAASHPTATRRRTPLTRIAGICMRVSFARRRQTMAPHPHATRTLPTRQRERERNSDKDSTNHKDMRMRIVPPTPPPSLPPSTRSLSSSSLLVPMECHSRCHWRRHLVTR